MQDYSFSRGSPLAAPCSPGAALNHPAPGMRWCCGVNPEPVRTGLRAAGSRFGRADQHGMNETAIETATQEQRIQTQMQMKLAEVSAQNPSKAAPWGTTPIAKRCIC